MEINLRYTLFCPLNEIKENKSTVGNEKEAQGIKKKEQGTK